MLKADEALNRIPENLQTADKAMRAASDALDKNKTDQALPKQQQAVDALKQAQGEMSQQMQERMKQMMMMAFGAGRLDPLGHPTGQGGPPNMFNGSNVKIPDQAQRKQVQDILRTLRQRSGDPSRPDYELEYYRRLMRQF